MKILDQISILEVRLRLSLINDTSLVLSITDGIERLLGYTLEDYLSGHISLKKQFHPDDLEIAQMLFSTKDISDGTSNIRLRQANGRIRCIKMHFRKEITADSVILHVLLQDSKSLYVTTTDFSDKVHFSAIMENTDDYIYFKDRNHVFTGASQSLVSLCSPAEHWTDLLGQTDYDVFPEDLADIYYRLEKQVFSGTPIAHEIQETLTCDGKKGWIDNRKYPIEDFNGEIIGLYGIARDITANEQIKNELIINEEKYKSLLNNLSIGVVVHSPDTSILLSNFRGASLLGLTIQQMQGKSAIDPYWKLYQENGLPLGFEDFPVNKVINSGKSHHDYIVGVRYSEVSELVWLLCNTYPINDDEGRLQQVVVTFTDVTMYKIAENELKIAAIAFESQNGIFITDSNCLILKVNEAYIQISGYTSEEIIGNNPRMFQSGRHDNKFYFDMWEDIIRTGSWKGEIWNRRKNGEIYPEHLTITAVTDNNNIVTHYVATIIDTTSKVAALKEIQKLAFYDPLTKLPNRRLLMDRLNKLFSSTARSHQRGALLFLDIDHFKMLNDTLGHNIGDLLLEQVAKRLLSCVRDNDSVARFGGDEFVILLEGLSVDMDTAAYQTRIVAEKVLALISEPYELESYQYNVTISIGATLFYDHDVSIEELLKQADIAMYQSKSQGRNTISFFNIEMQNTITTRVSREYELRQAIVNQEFELYYQVQVDKNGRPYGAEGLIRWLHPKYGIVSPLDFIPLAEETGLIILIGEWVLDTACAQLKLWKENEDTRHLTLSVNVSEKQFRQINFLEQVKTTVISHGIDPKLLKLELVESLLFEDVNGTIEIMQALKKIGIKFELDDFGTGYSSLQYLKKLPLYQLKIDQSFVRDISTDKNDKAIVLTIITMAHSLGLKVIAEGVETQEQQKFLIENSCDNFQGYLFSKPVPIEEFEKLVGVKMIRQ